MYASSKVQFCKHIRVVISFHIYHHCFSIQYSFFPEIHYSFWFIVIIIFLFKKFPNIYYYFILINLSLISLFLQFFFPSVSKSVQISNYSIFNYSVYNIFFIFRIKGFLMLLLLFCVFGFLSFFPLRYMVCLGMFVLKRLTTFSLNPSTILFSVQDSN